MGELVFETERKLKKIASKWYNPSRLFSHNSFISFVMSPRGNGKTYGGKKMMIDMFLKHGNQSVYVRRTDTQMKETKDEFFADISKEYPDHEFKVEGYLGLIDGEVAIFFIPLSTSTNKKSKALPNVKFIMFDEYIEPKGKKYLPNEMFLFLELLFTIGRDRSDYRIYICANAISYVNPFFSYFKMKPDPKKRFQKYKQNTICLELFESTVYQEEIMKTPFGRLIDGTDYCKYSVYNEVYEDTEDFILENGRKKIPNELHFQTSFKKKGVELCIWKIKDTPSFFCDYTIDPSSKNRYFVTPDDIEQGLVSLKSGKSNPKVKAVKNAFNDGKLWYENQEIKKFFQNEIINYL